MASTVIFKGQQCIWGTTKVNNTIGGICVSASLQRQGQHEPVEDENGARIGMVIYDETYSGTITVVCKAGESLPEIGTRITMNGFGGYVVDAKTDWQNKGKKQITVSIEGGKYLA